MSEYIRLQANGEDAFPDASSQNTYRDNGTSVEASLVALEGQITTLGGVAGEAKTLAEQNSVKIATAEREISDINSSLDKKANVDIVTTDLNFVSNAGVYFLSCWDDLPNKPVSNETGILLVSKFNADSILQVYIGVQYNKGIYTRYYENYNWSNWAHN